MPPLVYVVRRGVKEAMEAKADALILDMKTDGGRVDVTEEIIQIISKFPGLTVTYVNDRAFSAGAFIAVATQKIYMAPQSVIGAAAPIMMSPGGTGVEKLPDTVEAKMTSAIRALVRVQAEKNGHNIEVVEAMIDKTKELTMDGEVLNKEGSILTLTDRQAAKEYGNPPKPLLSLGTVESLDALLARLGYAGAQRVEIKPTGAEKLGTWINAIGPLLLIAGIIGLYIEFKTPGFGLPGIVGIAAFALYFFGGYVSGLSGAGWADGVRGGTDTGGVGMVRLSGHVHCRNQRRGVDAGGHRYGDGGQVSRRAQPAHFAPIASAAAGHQHGHRHLVCARADPGAIPSENVSFPQTRLAIGQRRQFGGRARGATGSAHRTERRDYLAIVSGRQSAVRRANPRCPDRRRIGGKRPACENHRSHRLGRRGETIGLI